MYCADDLSIVYFLLKLDVFVHFGCVLLYCFME